MSEAPTGYRLKWRAQKGYWNHKVIGYGHDCGSEFCAIVKKEGKHVQMFGPGCDGPSIFASIKTAMAAAQKQYDLLLSHEKDQTGERK